MESEGIQPSTMVSGYFNNGKWILQASQFERQARQLGVAQPRVTASAAAAVCGVSMAMECPWPWTVHGRLLFPLWLCRLVPSFGPLWPAWRPGPPLPARPARNVGTCAPQDLQPGALIDAEPGVLMKLGSELSTTQQGKKHVRLPGETPGEDLKRRPTGECAPTREVCFV